GGGAEGDELGRGEEGIVGNRGEGDGGAAPGEAAVAFDEVGDERAGEPVGRGPQREHMCSRLGGRDRPPPLLEQLDEPVDRVEGQLHSGSCNQNICSQSRRWPLTWRQTRLEVWSPAVLWPLPLGAIAH